jgi:hypothetical protein
MKTKHVILLILACAYGIYYICISEGYIRKNVRDGEVTALQAAVDLFSPKSPRERLYSLAEEFVAEKEKLSNFEEWKEKVESGRIT